MRHIDVIYSMLKRGRVGLNKNACLAWIYTPTLNMGIVVEDLEGPSPTSANILTKVRSGLRR